MNQPGETRYEAHSLSKKMNKLEIVILTEMWSSILSRINKISIALQKKTLTMDVATKLLTSLVDFLGNVRNEFDQYESTAKEKFPDADYKNISQRARTRSSRITSFDGPTENVSLTGKEKFKVETYLPIIDMLITQLKKRSASYNEINQRFGFFSRLKIINSPELQISCKEFAKFYHYDVNAEELELECVHLTQYLHKADILTNENGEMQISELYKLLQNDKVEDTFPNIAISLRIFLSLMVTNCSGERSFSKLSRIKNEIRSSMTQERLNYLSLMSIESDILMELDFEEVIEDFARQKSRKKPLINI